MGYIFSPGERSYEGIGVMTQRNEHTNAFAAFDAMEVSLSSSIDDARKMKELDKENNDPLLVQIIHALK